MAESKEKLKSLLMKEEEESEKADLKLNIQKTKTLASSLIISQKIEWESGSSYRFYFLGSKITVDSDCSHKLENTCPLEGKLWQNKAAY